MTLLLTGAAGQLGPYLIRRFLRDGHQVVPWTQQWSQQIEGLAPRQIELASADAVAAAFADAAPQVVIHAAAMSNIAGCLADPAAARRINVAATAQLADLAAARGARMIYLSTDLVFDGEKGDYRETDAANPLSVYGTTKHDAEAPVLASPGGVVVRLPLVIGPTLTGRAKFFEQCAAALREQRPMNLFDDEWRTPISPRAVAEGLAMLVNEASDFAGTLHLTGPRRLSRYEIGVRLARAMGISDRCLVPASRLSITSPEPRPRDTSLNGDRWRAMFPAFQPAEFESDLRPSPGAPARHGS